MRSGGGYFRDNFRGKTRTSFRRSEDFARSTARLVLSVATSHYLSPSCAARQRYRRYRISAMCLMRRLPSDMRGHPAIMTDVLLRPSAGSGHQTPTFCADMSAMRSASSGDPITLGRIEKGIRHSFSMLGTVSFRSAEVSISPMRFHWMTMPIPRTNPRPVRRRCYSAASFEPVASASRDFAELDGKQKRAFTVTDEVSLDTIRSMRNALAGPNERHRISRIVEQLDQHFTRNGHRLAHAARSSFRRRVSNERQDRTSSRKARSSAGIPILDARYLSRWI